jgi:hypothetical protein
MQHINAAIRLRRNCHAALVDSLASGRSTPQTGAELVRRIDAC